MKIIIIFILFFIIGIFAVPFVDQGEFWERYRQQLIGVLTKGYPPKYLQILTTPIDCLWDENPSQLKTLSNTVPFWSPYYSASNNLIDKQYTSFIYNINAGRTVERKDMETAYLKCDKEAIALSNALDASRDECMMQFMKLNPKPDFDTFNSKCLGTKKDDYETKKFECKYYEALAYGIQNQDLQESRSDVRDGTNWFEMIGSLKKFREDCQNNQTTSVSLDVNFFSAVEKPLQWNDIQGMAGPSKINDQAFGSLLKNPQIAFKTEQSRFKMVMTFKGFSVIRVAPGKWFRQSIIDKYRNGPFINTSPNYFGVGGTMRLKPTAFYVVYQPQLELFMENEDLDQFVAWESKYKSGFFSSSSSYKSIQKTRTTGDKNSVVITSNNKNPVLIAVECELI